MIFKQCLLIEKERFLLFIPVILGIGILTGVFFPFSSVNKFIISLGVFVLISLVFYRTSKFLTFTLLIFLLGVYISQTGGILDFDFLPQKKFLEKEHEGINFEATVKFIEETHPTMKNMRRVVFKNIKFPSSSEDLSFIKTAKMTCSVNTSENIFPGDVVNVKGKLMPFKPPAIPGAFDQRQYNSLIKIDANGVVYYIKKINKRNNLDYFSYFRRILTKNIVLKIKGKAGGIASALLTGDKSSIPNPIREVFINSGTAHILAISGLHMSILASLTYFLFLKIFQYFSCIFYRIKPRLFASILTIPIMFLYLGLSGFSPSAIRAFIMTLFFMVSIILERGVLSLRSVAIAAFLILIFDPASLFLVSFQLSFCAVVALISFYERYQEQLNQFKLQYDSIFWKVAFYIFASFLTTIIASLATLPVSIATFNRLNCTGILGNLIAIPAMSFLIVPVGVFSLITIGFSELGIKALEFILNKLIDILSLVSMFPYSNITIKSPGLLTLYIIISGGIILCLCHSKIRHLGWLGIAFGIMFWGLEKKPNIIVPPQSNIVCFVENNNFYTTSVQKGRRSALAIQRNLGFEGKLIKKPFAEELPKEPENGLYIWTKHNCEKEIALRKHPYCPAYFQRIRRIDN